MVLVGASAWNPKAQIINCKNKITINGPSKAMFQTRDILVQIRESVPLTNGSGSCCSVSDLYDANKKFICSQFFAYYFFKVHLHQSSKIKGHKTVETKFL